MQNNTVINLSLAFFVNEPINNAELLANRINSRLNQMFNVIDAKETYLASDSRGIIPLLEMRTNDGEKQIFISKERIDLFFSPNLLNQQSISNTVQKYQKFIYSFFKTMIDERSDIYRLGLVLSTYYEQEKAGEFINNNYCSLNMNNLTESLIRINNTNTLEQFTINNVFSIRDGVVNNDKLGIKQFGAIATRDINNAPIQKVFLSEDNLLRIWKYALKYFTNEKMGRIADGNQAK